MIQNMYITKNQTDIVKYYILSLWIFQTKPNLTDFF